MDGFKIGGSEAFWTFLAICAVVGIVAAIVWVVKGIIWLCEHVSIQ